MALAAEQVEFAITGEVHVAPIGTPAPTSATSALDAAFVGLGYLNEDGVVQSFEESSESVRAWQDNAVIRTITTESEGRLAFTMVQSTKAVIELFHKGSEIVSDGGEHTLYVLPPKSDPRSFVFDVIDGETHKRIYIPRGEVVERGETEYVSGTPVGYNVTIASYPTEQDVNGETQTVAWLEFSNNPSWGESS